MTARYIFSLLAAGFLIAFATSRWRGGNPASRAWLIIGTIFALVSLFLFIQS
jgi:hypothetical protein